MWLPSTKPILCWWRMGETAAFLYDRAGASAANSRFQLGKTSSLAMQQRAPARHSWFVLLFRIQACKQRDPLSSSEWWRILWIRSIWEVLWFQVCHAWRPWKYFVDNPDYYEDESRSKSFELKQPLCCEVPKLTFGLFCHKPKVSVQIRWNTCTCNNSHINKSIIHFTVSQRQTYN